MINRSPLLRGFDEEARDLVVAQMEASGIKIITGVVLDKVEKTEGGFSVHGSDNRDAQYGAVIYATGRVPLTEGLGLEDAGVVLNKNGSVKVDEWSQTNIPSIYAVGDVTDRINLTPVAIREAMPSPIPFSAASRAISITSSSPRRCSPSRNSRAAA